MKKLLVRNKTFHYFSLETLHAQNVIKKLPFSIKILIENLLRQQTKTSNSAVQKLLRFYENDFETFEISFNPARVLCQDFTGVPAVVDLAAMRDACVKAGKNPDVINPHIPVDLVVDHSVMVDKFASKEAFKQNVSLEYERNTERYEFLKWGQTAFKNFRVVPPGTGICHQVNLEYLSKVIWENHINGKTVVYPDTLVGTDSHTTMINGLSVLGWGVGGIEAESAMLGQPISMLIPEVVGMRLIGSLQEGVTATDLVLNITNLLRTKGVVGKFVEFFGSGLDNLPLADRATIANMAPEYGATCGFFPIDDETLTYMRLSGRDEEHIDLIETYAKAQYLWRYADEEPEFKDTLTLDISLIRPTVAGPKRPQDKILLHDVHHVARQLAPQDDAFPVKGKSYKIRHQDVMIAAITSCTNTSNPAVMIAAGLLAKKAYDLGMKVKPWVKTSLAPGSQVVTDYIERADLMTGLNSLGFNLVGYGCTTCIGNSGPLEEVLQECIEKNNLDVSAVLSGNRNFEGRISPHVKSSYLASPPLVVAYALAGSTKIDLDQDPLGEDKNKTPVYLKDLWPSSQEINALVNSCVTPEFFQERYAHVFDGDQQWQDLKAITSQTYAWKEDSTYIKQPPYFETGINSGISNIENARILGLFGDSITTDHISPAGSIKIDSPAGAYLMQCGVQPKDFNSYGARRGHDEVMIRGTFANIRLQNEITPERIGGYTKSPLSGNIISIYDAAMEAKSANIPLVIIAGKEYGTGSSRDWAAKGTRLLNVKAVIAESFERIHRSNLIGMGVLPLTFKDGETRKSLKLIGNEQISIHGIYKDIQPACFLDMQIAYQDGTTYKTTLLCRIDTKKEMDYFISGGILPYVLGQS
jgi:aconitate hydratase